VTLSGVGAATFGEAVRAADTIIERVGKTIVLALPLGLGKANHIANALYAKAVADRSIRLQIFTALTLEPPRARQELERRFLDPLSRRVFAGYPPLDYATAIHNGTLPPNIHVNEFFLEAGQWLDSPYAQQNYISVNYTHALRAILDRGVNVVAQLVAYCENEKQRPFSLSCNPDLTLDLLALRRQGRVSFLLAGQINSELPFMGHDAAIEAGEFDVLLNGPTTDFALFAPPRQPVALPDYAAGLYAASTVPDGGTLQIGIGSMGDAVAQSLIVRHTKPSFFTDLLTRLGSPDVSRTVRHTASFETGLYACTEMFVEGLLDLYRAGILKREVDGAVVHAGFFLGSRAFYKALREMPRDIADKFQMRSISYVNALYGNEDEKRRARVDARFINNAMIATALGDVVSDGLEDGRIVSGVGGQYNFVAQAFALEGARSVMLLRASRTSRGKSQSNIRWNYGHTTIPRHLRDMIVTEYGIADIRGKSDRDVIAAMLTITDQRFQGDLLRQAKDAGKIERWFELPKAARGNTPEAIERALKPAMEAGLLSTFPFGTDLTEIEQRLLLALQTLKSASTRELAAFMFRGLAGHRKDLVCLDRVGLAKPRRPAEWLYSILIRGALSQS
jgi:acyl-CoA hydrolase